MRTLDEVNYAFTPIGKLDEGQRARMLKLEVNFKELATDIVDLVPECADRTAALRKLLETKFTCVQAVSHFMNQAPAKEKANEKENKAEKNEQSPSGKAK